MHAHTAYGLSYTVSQFSTVHHCLFRVITPDYADHWKIIGDLLGIRTTLLDATETTNPTNQQWCCNDMLKLWLARNTSATWKDILAAIDSLTITQGVSSSVAVRQTDSLNGMCKFCFFFYKLNIL